MQYLVVQYMEIYLAILALSIAHLIITLLLNVEVPSLIVGALSVESNDTRCTCGMLLVPASQFLHNKAKKCVAVL